MRLRVLVFPGLVLAATTAMAQWQPAQQLTSDPGASYLCGQQCIAAGGDTLHVVFADDRSDTFNIYYMRSLNAAATWDSAARLSFGDHGGLFSAALAASGPTVHVAWP